jgi:D-proline reductase (dithiol) PrdB
MPAMSHTPVDPWRFTGSFLTEFLSGQIPDTPKHDPIPWAERRKPLAESKLALLSTAGISMAGDTPFDMEFERKNPTKGDPSWRALRSDATGDTIEANHLHIDTSYIRRDLNVALPLDRARELVVEGEIGSLAETHYSTMGYQGNDATTQSEKSGPEIAAHMKNEGVDLALLAPV